MKIMMLLDNCFDPDVRVYKEALYLVQNNEVEILCLDKKNKYKDKPVEEKDNIKIKRFFSRTEKTTELIEKNFIIRKLKFIIYFWWLIKFFKKIKKYLKNQEYDVLHCHDLMMAFGACILFRKQKIVFDMHELYANKKSKILNWIINKIVKYTQKKSTWIIHVNNFQIENIHEKDKIIHLPNYPQKYKFDNLQYKKADKLRISYTGYVRHYIPIINLMKAVDKLENIEVSVNGNGPLYEKLNEESKKMKNTIFTGSYNHDDIAKFYENSDIVYCVYNKGNRNDETAIPTKFFEALISETPLIVAKNTEMSKFVEEYDIGFCVDGEDSDDIRNTIENIQNNPDILSQKRKNIKAISNKYSWENVVKNLDIIYKEGN